MSFVHTEERHTQTKNSDIIIHKGELAETEKISITNSSKKLN